MGTKVFDSPALYGDHHVSEVRRILLEMPGVKDVYASSAFRSIEVTFDPSKVKEAEIAARLESTGYLNELPVMTETGKAVTDGGSKEEFRHTAVYVTTRSVVSFAQQVNYQGRPLWPCPGMGVIQFTLKKE